MPYPVLHRGVSYCGTDLGGTRIHSSSQLSTSWICCLKEYTSHLLASFSPCLGLYPAPLKGPLSLSSLGPSLCPGPGNFKV